MHDILKDWHTCCVLLICVSRLSRHSRRTILLDQVGVAVRKIDLFRSHARAMCVIRRSSVRDSTHFHVLQWMVIH